ncbi:MAG: hypothetical protein J6O40_01880 [Ruminococcus sp.]|nr:hypothetical protein [Ruminococcus sp.]
MNYDQLIFSELRLLTVKMGEGSPDDAALIKAVTVNEELLALGYTLSPKDIALLSLSPSIDTLAKRVREYVGDVKAEPMYPDFPNQVMKMDEATFRFHQMIHYLSTYGVEELFGAKVKKGWLPETEKTEKTEADDKLLAAKVVELIDEKQRYIIPFKKILTRTERMDDKQRLIIRECAERLPAKEIISINVTFKQNLLDLFNAVFTSERISSENKIKYLHAMCQHTGDVLKCTDYALTRAKYHFRTSQKKLLVKLIESYPVEDLRENLILSNKKSERCELMLRFMDYNTYSRSGEHKKAVRELRNGQLRSWESKAKALVEFGDAKALDFYAARPGMMLRSLTYLLRNGYKADDVYKALAPKAKSLKTQTLMSLMSFFSRPELSGLDDKRYQESLIINIMISSLLKSRLFANRTPLWGKKVYVDCKDYDLDQSAIRINDRSAEGGYIRSGLAYKIPDEVKRLRFFIYWNDKERVDVDLHASARLCDGSYENIGWNANFKNSTLVFSGDITHSDAAEFIDIDLENGRDLVDTVGVNINLFSGYNTFKEIDECFVGAMAVSKTGEEVKLYDPKNCFFSHYLKGNYRKINYGYVDVANRVIVFDGIADKADGYYNVVMRNNGFSLKNYLDILFEAQMSTVVDDPARANVILVMGKPEDKKQLSLIDNNFFME